MKMQESGENYLETILVLKREKGAVRSIDIAQRMNFTKPSISRAMSLLRENGYITMDESMFIELTDAGMEIAQRIYERHTLLTQFLERLGVSPETAAHDACKIEHDLSDESFEKIKEHARSRQIPDGG